MLWLLGGAGSLALGCARRADTQPQSGRSRPRDSKPAALLCHLHPMDLDGLGFVLGCVSSQRDVSQIARLGRLEKTSLFDPECRA